MLLNVAVDAAAETFHPDRKAEFEGKDVLVPRFFLTLSFLRASEYEEVRLRSPGVAKSEAQTG